jgi:hypothetical protein
MLIRLFLFLILISFPSYSKDSEIVCRVIQKITPACQDLLNCQEARVLLSKKVDVSSEISSKMVDYCYSVCMMKYVPDNLRFQMRNEINGYMKNNCGVSEFLK